MRFYKNAFHHHQSSITVNKKNGGSPLQEFKGLKDSREYTKFNPFHTTRHPEVSDMVQDDGKPLQKFNDGSPLQGKNGGSPLQDLNGGSPPQGKNGGSSLQDLNGGYPLQAPDKSRDKSSSSENRNIYSVFIGKGKYKIKKDEKIT